MKVALIAVALAAVAFSEAQAAEFTSQNSTRWSGAYLGGHVGYDWGSASVTDTNGGVLPGPFNYNPNAVFGGATAGYNVQFKDVVVGVEADLGYMDINGAGIAPSSTPQTIKTSPLIAVCTAQRPAVSAGPSATR